MKMKPFSEMPAHIARDIRFVLFDIDDTVTLEGKLTDGAYSAMWRLYHAGLMLIPVTGRPAGWCDMIMREWPVEAVICENGAFALYNGGDGHIRTLLHPNAAPDPAPKLEELKRAVLDIVPGARLARDQAFRIYDAAFDFAEDEPRLDDATVEGVMRVCRERGARYKLSSIHVNAWYGEYDKLSMARLYFSKVHAIEDARDRALFFGDSPNDEPMFGYFPLSCGVENVREYERRMQALPTYIIEGRGGIGFAAASELLLKMRGEGGL